MKAFTMQEYEGWRKGKFNTEIEFKQPLVFSPELTGRCQAFHNTKDAYYIGQICASAMAIYREGK